MRSNGRPTVGGHNTSRHECNYKGRGCSLGLSFARRLVKKLHGSQSIMNPASGKCLGIAELTATDHLLEWEVVGEVLRLREADASVDIRLGNFFQDISSCFLASGLRSFWLCFLSHNDVVLRFRFQGGLAPLAEAMEGNMRH